MLGEQVFYNNETPKKKKKKAQSPDRHKSVASSNMLSDGAGKAEEHREKQKTWKSELLTFAH